MPPMLNNEPTIDALAALLKAAADPLRLQVLQVLGSNSFAASELSALLGLGQSRLSHHLKLLAQAKLVEAKREGNTLFYRRCLPNWKAWPKLRHYSRPFSPPQTRPHVMQK